MSEKSTPRRSSEAKAVISAPKQDPSDHRCVSSLGRLQTLEQAMCRISLQKDQGAWWCIIVTRLLPNCCGVGALARARH